MRKLKKIRYWIVEIRHYSNMYRGEDFYHDTYRFVFFGCRIINEFIIVRKVK